MEPLPLSKDRDGSYDSLVVIVDHLTGMVHLVPGRTTYKARDVAELVFSEVYKLHGMPRAIVSDRDSKFTSQFWKHLNHLVGTKLKMSSAYHPQSDGLTERANRTIEQMLRQCIAPNQKDWVAKLPAIEFAINLARSETTGYSPFFLNSGRIPRSMIWDTASKTEFPGVRVFAQRLKNAILEAHDNILDTRIKQTRDANRRRRQVPFKLDDLVYVSTKNITLPKGTARKLVPKYIGPFRIIRDFDNGTFEVALPARLKQRGIHGSFHASLLRIHVPNDDRLFPGRSETQILPFDKFENEWAVDAITAHCGTGQDLMFTVKWKAGDTTLLPLKDVEHLHALPEYLETLGLDSIDDLKRNKVKSYSVPTDVDPQILYAGAISLEINHFGDAHGNSGLYKGYTGQGLDLINSLAPFLQLHFLSSLFHQLYRLSTMAPPPRPIESYNLHPRVVILGHNSVVVQASAKQRREGYEDSNFARDQVEGIFTHDNVLRQASKTSSFPENYTSPFGFEYFTKVLNHSPHWKDHFCTIDRSEGKIHVPDNRPPRINDLLPPVPIQVTQNEVDYEELQSYRANIARRTARDDERFMMSKLRRKKETEAKKGLKTKLTESRLRGIHRTFVHARQPGPYPQSTLITPVAGPSTLNLRAPDFVPSEKDASADEDDDLANYQDDGEAMQEDEE